MKRKSITLAGKRYSVGRPSENAMAVVDAIHALNTAAHSKTGKSEGGLTLEEAALEYAGWFAALYESKKNAGMIK